MMPGGKTASRISPSKLPKRPPTTTQMTRIQGDLRTPRSRVLGLRKAVTSAALYCGTLLRNFLGSQAKILCQHRDTLSLQFPAQRDRKHKPTGQFLRLRCRNRLDSPTRVRYTYKFRIFMIFQ